MLNLQNQSRKKKPDVFKIKNLKKCIQCETVDVVFNVNNWSVEVVCGCGKRTAQYKELSGAVEEWDKGKLYIRHLPHLGSTMLPGDMPELKEG